MIIKPFCSQKVLQAYNRQLTIITRVSTGKGKELIPKDLITISEESRNRLARTKGAHEIVNNLTKAEIIGLGLKLGVSYELTHSCYDPTEDKACGQCSACFFRKKGFSDAGVMDPTRYV